MNCLSQLSSYSAAILTKTTYFVAKRSFHGCSNCSWTRKLEYSPIKTVNLQFVLTKCFSTKRARKSASKLQKLEPEPVMEQEKDAFFVVRKGDVVGIYNSLADCQAQVGSSVCDPPVSVYKGYSMSKDAEEYFVSRGLKNALYTLRAADLTEDLFGMLVPCPFQDPASSKGDITSKDASKKRSLEAIGQENIQEGTSLIKHGKYTAGTQEPSSEIRTCILEFDGASKGNPGTAGAGAILRTEDGSLICRLREGVGVATNNVAEYRAMILGMKYALKMGFTGICIRGDSKLVCNQIDGSWRVRHQNMSDMFKVAKELKDQFLSFQINHVLRNFNSDADAEANLAIGLADGQVVEVFED